MHKTIAAMGIMMKNPKVPPTSNVTAILGAEPGGTKYIHRHSLSAIS